MMTGARWAGGVAAFLVVILGLWTGICVRYVAHPRLDPHERVDALYVLGPLETRVGPALGLASEGLTPVVLATESIDQTTGEPYFTQYCGVETSTYRVECVVPTPYTTRGEARALAAQVTKHGWTRVAILASTAQAERARLLMGRCVSATVLVWDYPESRSLIGWLMEFLHQSGGWVQAQFDRDC